MRTTYSDADFRLVTPPNRRRLGNCICDTTWRRVGNPRILHTPILKPHEPISAYTTTVAKSGQLLKVTNRIPARQDPERSLLRVASLSDDHGLQQ